MKTLPLLVPSAIIVVLGLSACGSDDEADTNGSGGMSPGGTNAGGTNGGEANGGDSSGGAGAPGEAGAGGSAGVTGAFSQSSVELDGETGYLALGAFTDVVDGDAQPLTISVWVKARGEIMSGAGIVNLKTSGSFGQSIDLFWSTELDEPSIAFYVPGGDVRAIVAEPNAWTHVVAVYDPAATSDSGRLYLNGELIESLDTASSTLEIEGESEAGRYATTLYLDGFLDDLAIWRAALSDEAVVAVYNQGKPNDLSVAHGAYDSAADLSAYWRMGDDDAAASTTVSDVAAGNDATLAGQAQFSDDVP